MDLGYQMTISARGGYPTVQNNIEHLVAFNELQHKLYNQMLHCQTNNEWYKVEELLETFASTRFRQGCSSHQWRGDPSSCNSLSSSRTQSQS